MAAVAPSAAALGAFRTVAFLIPVILRLSQAQDACSIDPDLCPASPIAESCEDTPGWDNGVAGCKERGFSEADGCGANGWTCKRYESKWCKDGKTVPGMEFSLGSRFKYPEQHCCVCGGGKKEKKVEQAPPVQPEVVQVRAAPKAQPAQTPKDTGLSFIRTKGRFCSGNIMGVLNQFPDPSDERSLEKCEAYCVTDARCWGCSIHCAPTCQWNAIPSCGETMPFPGKLEGDISQKPPGLVAKQPSASEVMKPAAAAMQTAPRVDHATPTGNEEAFVIDNSKLQSLAEGIEYRTAKKVDARAGEEHYVAYGTTVKGIDSGDGWLQVGKFYLPTHVRGVQVLVKKEVATTTTTTTPAAGPQEANYQLDNSVLKSPAEGVEFRLSKKSDDRAGEEHFIAYGKTFVGVDDGDGWVKVGKYYLPTAIRGIQVVQKQASAGSATCTDVPDWVNGFAACHEKGFTLAQGCVAKGGFSCHGYVLQGWCSGTALIPGMEWATGPGFKSPETSCCACGGGKRSA